MVRLNRFTIGLTVSALCVVVVLAFVLTGKGGDANLVSGSAIAEAAEATERVPGANVSMHISVDVSGLSEPIQADMDGVQDTRGKTGKMTGAYTHFPKKVPGQRPDGSVPIAGIAIGPDLYMKSPIFASELPKDKDWLHIDLAKAGEEAGIGDPTQFTERDPMESVRSLRAVSPRVERAGHEKVRGVSTTHYRAIVELRRVPDTLPSSKRAAATKGIEKLIQLTGTDSYPVEVWVDSHRLVRRMKLTQKMKVAQTDKDMTMVMTMEMFDFGRKPAVHAPPEDSTFDATKLAGKSGG